MAYADVIIADTPVAYWRLGEPSGSPLDSSGNGHTLTANGSPTYGVTGALNGDPNTAMTFNGTTQYLQVLHASWMDFGDVFTFETWAKRPAAVNLFEYLVRLYDPGPSLELRAGVPYLRTSSTLLRHGTDITGSDWHHVVVTKDADDAFVYIDGADVTVFDDDDTAEDGTYALVIAADVDGQAEPFAGSLDEVAVYDYALSAEQVLAHYTAGITAPAEPVTVLELTRSYQSAYVRDAFTNQRVPRVTWTCPVDDEVIAYRLADNHIQTVHRACIDQGSAAICEAP